MGGVICVFVVIGKDLFVEVVVIVWKDWSSWKNEVVDFEKGWGNVLVYFWWGCCVCGGGRSKCSFYLKSGC